MRGGYTILEVMIFLAISGFMFTLAAVFVSGKQSSAEFRQGMNDINTQIQQVINDVSNGFYPSDATFTCTSTANAGSLSIAGGSTTQGANGGARGPGQGGCVFLGKVMQFTADGDPTKYYVYSVAGSQYANGATSGLVPNNYDDSQPTAIYNSANGVDLTQKKVLQWGLRVSAMFDNTAGHTPLSAVGFYGSPGSYSGSTLQSGSQTTTVLAIPSAAASSGESEAAMAGDINSGSKGINIRSNPNILICFTNQGNQFGAVTIGGTSGQRLTTDMQIGNTAIAGCS